MMGSARGQPYRVRFDAFKLCFERAGLSVEAPYCLTYKTNTLDDWLKDRATENLLTTEAIFVLRRNS